MVKSSMDEIEPEDAADARASPPAPSRRPVPPSAHSTHRTTRPYTPQTNGMAERLNGRIQREVLTITVGSHRDLERLLEGHNQAYNARPQRALKGRSPYEVV